MDEFVKDILEQWNLASLIDSFKDNDIDEEVFKLLTNEMIRELIPKVGMRFKFEQRFKEFKKDLGLVDDTTDTISVKSDSSASTSTSVSLSHASDVNPEQLEEMLLASSKGRLILKKFENLKALDRPKLASFIIDRETEAEADARITSQRFEAWALQITRVFPGECKELYYVPYSKGITGPISARGMLWDKYVNKRRVLRQIGMLPTRHGTLNEESTVDVPVSTESVEWLKNNIEPLDELLKKWTETCSIRLESSQINTVYDYFQTYKGLTLSTGYLLVDIDFKYLHGDTSNKWLVEWPAMAAKIVQCAQRKTDKSIQSFLTEHCDLISKGACELIALMLLPMLLGTVTLKSKQVGKHWRPSRLEVQASFILHIPTIDNYQTSLEERKAFLQKQKLTDQPFPVFVGPLDQISNSLVVINDTTYSLPSALKAFETTFKCFFAFRAKYPAESEHVWVFIERHLFHIKTASQKNYVSVNKLISDLNSI